MRRQYVEVPLPLSRGLWGKATAGISALLLAPAYLAAAWLKGAPGLRLHVRIVAIAVRLTLQHRLPFKACLSYVFFPMDSTRYFEFGDVWRSALPGSFTRYLDVSSPRFAPLLLLGATTGATAEFINPDVADLEETVALARAMQLDSRIGFFNGVLDEAPYSPSSFDLVTCISVLEHIPEDSKAVRTMWSLLRPGGKLLLTLPCMALPLEQYISHNQYGVLAPGDDGYTFWQRYYDREGLEARIFSITGAPARMAVYGEKRQGLFFRNATAKRLLGPRYPVWREPYMMATEWRYFDSIAELPGDGVVLLEFIKPATV